MFRLTAVAVCVLLTLSATGQQRKYNVVLNDGSRISGTIVADSAGYLDIKVITPQVIRIGKSQVSSVEALTYPVKKNLKTCGLLHQVFHRLPVRKKRKWQPEQSQLSSFKRIPVQKWYWDRNRLRDGRTGSGSSASVCRFKIHATKLRDIALCLAENRLRLCNFRSGCLYIDDSASADSKTMRVASSSTPGQVSPCLHWKRTAINIGIGYRYQKVTVSRDQYWWWGRNSVREYCNPFQQTGVASGFYLHVKEEIWIMKL